MQPGRSSGYPVLPEDNTEPASPGQERPLAAVSPAWSTQKKPSGGGPRHIRAVNLLEEQRRLIQERKESHARRPIEAVRRLHPVHRDLVPPAFNLPTEAFGSSSSSTAVPEYASSSYAAQEFSKEHLDRCRGRLVRTDKKSLAQIVRGTFGEPVPPVQRRSRAVSTLVVPELTEGVVPGFAMPTAAAKAAMHGEGFVRGVLRGLGVHQWAHRSLLLWHQVVRAMNYERKRAAMQVSLVWDDPRRAETLMTARKTLEEAERLSWLQIDPQYSKDVISAAFPLSAPPILRNDTYDDFERVGDSLRGQLRELVTMQQERYAQSERVMMEHRLLKKTTKDVRWLRRMNEQGERNLSQAKRHLMQAVSFTRLVELLYVGTIVRSAENSAVFLSQLFADSAFLQMHVMVAPQLVLRRPKLTIHIDDDFNDCPGWNGLVAELVPSPSHAELQANLNALLHSVVTIAGSVVNIRRPVLASPDISSDFSVLTVDPGMNRGNGSLLRRYLAASSRYRAAVSALDTLLHQSFEVMQRHLDGVSQVFGVDFIMRIALLSTLYIEPAKLLEHIRGNTGVPPPKVDNSTMKALLTGVDLSDFLLFWLAPPSPKDRSVRQLFVQALQAFVENGNAEAFVGCLPHHIAKRLESLTKGNATGKDAVEEGPRSCADFTAAWQAVHHGSSSVAEVVVAHLLQHGQFTSPGMGKLPQDANHTMMLCDWFQKQAHLCQRWHEAAKNINIVYASGPFSLDTKFLSFVALQVAPMTLATSVHMLNLYGVEHGRKLWRDVQAVVTDLHQEVTQTSELVRQLHLLGNIYELITGYVASRKQLERMLKELESVACGQLLTEATASGQPMLRSGDESKLHRKGSVQLAADETIKGTEEPKAGATSAEGGQTGSLSTGLLSFLVKSIEEALEVLCAKTDEVVAATARRVITFHHKVQDETMTVNAKTRAIRAQMESQLEPSPTLAHDVRCQALAKARGGAKASEQEESETEVNASKAALEAEQLLTVSSLRTYIEVEERLAKFERQCDELLRWRQLIQQFEIFASKENVALQVPVVNIDELLVQKLAHLKLFWSSTRDWDRCVDLFLPMRPDRVNVNEVQRQAHKILAMVVDCPKAHQQLLRQRIDSFRRLLAPLFLSQVIVSLSPSRRVRIFDETRQPAAAGPSQQSAGASKGHPRHGSDASPSTELPQLSSLAKQPGSASAASGGHPVPRRRPSAFHFPGEPPVFPPEQVQMWEELLGQSRHTPAEYSSTNAAVSITASITTLRAMIRTGALAKRDEVRAHYDSAIGELEVVSRLLGLDRFWSHRPLPLVAYGDTSIIVSAESVLQRIQEHMIVTTEVTGQLDVPSKSNEPGATGAAADAPLHKVTVRTTYLALAQEWQVRLQRMRSNFLQLLKCQEMWLKLSMLTQSSVPPQGEAGSTLSSANTHFRLLMSQIILDPILAHCLDLQLDMQYVATIQKLLMQARQALDKDLRQMKLRCPRLHFMEDDCLLQLWGYTAHQSEERQMAVVNNAIPKIFPGWHGCKLVAAEALDMEHRPLRLGSKPQLPTPPGLKALGIVLDASERTFTLLEAVALVGTPDVWTKALETMVARSFQERVAALAPIHDVMLNAPSVDCLLPKAIAHPRISKVRLEEPVQKSPQNRRGSHDSPRLSIISDVEDFTYRPRSNRRLSARPGKRVTISGADATQQSSEEETEESTGTYDPDHVLCTVARLRWTALLHSLVSHEEAEAIAILGDHNAAELDHLVKSKQVSAALLCLNLEYRDLLDSARGDRLPLSRWVFPRVWWKDVGHIGVAFDQVSLDFGWELYSGKFLACPLSERRYATIAQQLNACKATLLQGDLGATTTVCFAAVCGVPCYQLYVLPEQTSLEDLYVNLCGGAKAGYWLVLHGVCDLIESFRSQFLKHLARCFSALSAYLDASLAISPSRLQGDGQIVHAELGSYAHLCCAPPGVLFIRDRVCLIGSQESERPSHNVLAGHLWSASKFEQSGSCRPNMQRRGSEGALSRATPTGIEANNSQAQKRNDAQDMTSWVPQAIHPRIAVFMTQSSTPGQELASHVVRIAAFARPDLYVYMRAGLIQAGVLDIEAANTLANAMRAYNSLVQQPVSPSDGRRSATRPLGTSEVRSICALVSALRQTRATNVVGQVDDRILLCEAWLLAVSAVLDAAVERDLLWYCTLMTFGRLARFGENEQFFKQCLWNDTLVSRRFVKKDRDFNAMMYDAIADTLKEKYSFFNSLIVQKSLAITNSILQQRHVAVVGSAGCGKTECVGSLLKAGSSFRDDHQQPLFQGVKLVRINPLAHNVRKLIAMCTEAAVARQGGWHHRLRPTSKSKNAEDAEHSSTSLLESTTSVMSSRRRRAGRAFTHENCAEASSLVRTWLVLDGPLDPALLENVVSETPLHLLDAEPLLETPLPMRVLIETDQLANVSPALASSLAITFIDTQRGPTWKDKVVAWAHQLGKTSPQYTPLLATIRDLTAHLIDSILAFVLYYFHSSPSDVGVEATAPRFGTQLNYVHQVSSFLSFFTSMLLDPVIEANVFKSLTESKAGEGDNEGFDPEGQPSDGQEKVSEVERTIRLLVAMASISSFGLCLFTHQRPRFERFIRERVLDPSYAESLPPLYDLHFDWKSGRFELVTELVRIGDAIVDDSEILVPTAEFAAFQLRLRRLTAIGVPVMLVGTAGSGKSVLMRYLQVSPSQSLLVVHYSVGPASTPEEQQGMMLNHLQMHNAAFLAPAAGKRFILLLDDLHMSRRSTGGGLQGGSGNLKDGPKAPRGSNRCGDKGEGYSALAEWMRFVLEHRGFYNVHDGSFVALRDVSFLPSLLSPGSQALPFCQRFCRHFFIFFRETPPQASIERIFSTIWRITLRPVMQDFATTAAASVRRHSDALARAGKDKVKQLVTSRQAVIKSMMDATLNTCEFAELGSTQRLHGLARVFWNVAYIFNLAPQEALQSEVEVGALWGYAMRSLLLDSVETEHPQRRRQVASAIVRNCERHFGLTVKQREEAPLGLQLQRATTGDVSPRTRQRDGRSNTIEDFDLDDVVYDLAGVLNGGDGQGCTQPYERLAQLQGASNAAAFRRPLLEELGLGSNEDVCKEDAPAVGSLAQVSFSELLHRDGSASAMWLQDDQMLCTLMRLCHALFLHPVVSIIGGWAHFPLLTLAVKILSRGEGTLRLCTRLSGDALEKELLQASSPAPHGQQTTSRMPSKEGAVPPGEPSEESQDDGPADQVSPSQQAHFFVMGEEEVPNAKLQAFLQQERSRFFTRLISATSGVSYDDDDEDAGGHVGDRVQDLARSASVDLGTGTAITATEPQKQTSLTASSLRLGDGLNKTALIIMCRSASSLRLLAMRSKFVQHYYAATFMLPLAASLQQTAIGYISSRGGGVISPAGALPSSEKRIVKNSPRNVTLKPIKRDSVAPRRGGRMSMTEARTFVPLARCLELVHLQVQQTLATEYGRDFAAEYCSPSRFAQLLQAVTRLARQLASERLQQLALHGEALSTLRAIRNLSTSLSSELRAVRVSLRLMVEEAGTLTSRVARVTTKRASARETLEGATKKKEDLDARIAAVDSRYAPRLNKAKHAADVAFRDLTRLEAEHFEDLGKFRHPPMPLVKSLDTVKLIISQLRDLDKQDGDDDDAVGKVADFNAIDRQYMANKNILDLLRRWNTDRLMAPWLAAAVERLEADPDCHPKELQPTNHAAAHLVTWLRALLDCHRVLSEMETRRQSMGDLSQQMAAISEELSTARQEVAKAEHVLEGLLEQHTSVVQKREELLRDETRLQNQVDRLQFILGAFVVRERECRVQLASLEEGENDISRHIGGILHVAARSVYFAAFSPPIRNSLSNEVKKVLADCDLASPEDVNSPLYLSRFLPSTLLHRAQAQWRDKYLFESAVALETTSSCCSILLDPFDMALDWLKAVYVQRYPVQRTKQEQVVLGGYGKAEKQAPFKDAEEDDGDSVSRIDIHASMSILSVDEDPDFILDELQQCVRARKAMVIQSQCLAQLWDCLGPILVALHHSEVPLQVLLGHGSRDPLGSRDATAAGTSNYMSQRSNLTAADAELEEQAYTRRQQLEHALPLPYRRFRLFVLVKECPWSVSFLRSEQAPVRQKQQEFLALLPTMLWSLCQVVSFDTRPAHPVDRFASVLQEAVNKQLAAEVVRGQHVLAINRLRLEVVEATMLELLATSDRSALDDEELHGQVQIFSKQAERLSTAVATSLQQQNHSTLADARESQAVTATLAALCATLLHAQVAASESDLARGGCGKGFLFADNAVVTHLNAHVGGFALAPQVLFEIAIHMLRSTPDPKDALGTLLWLLLAVAGERQACIIQLILVLEGGLVQDEKLATLWENVVRAAAQAVGVLEFSSDVDVDDGHEAESEDEEDVQHNGSSEENSDASSEADQSESDTSDSVPSLVEHPLSRPVAATSAEDLPAQRSSETSRSSVRKSVVLTDHVVSIQGEESDSSDEQDEDSEDEEGSGSGDDELSTESNASKGSEEKQTTGDTAEDNVSQTTHAKEFLEMTENLGAVVRKSFPPLASERHRDAMAKLRLLPAGVPIMLAHDSIPDLMALARRYSIKVKEISPIRSSLKPTVVAELQQNPTWVLIDLADVTDFVELNDLLQLRTRPARVRRLSTPHAARSSSRIFLHCSLESQEVPRHLLRLCFCVQDSIKFFRTHKEAGTGSISDPSASYEVPGMSKQLPSDAAGLVHTLKTAVIHYLSRMHPLLVLQGAALTNGKFTTVMGGIAAGLAASESVEDLFQCKLDDIPQWIETRVVKSARTWLQNRTMCCLLRNLTMPVQSGEKQVKETMRTTMASISNLTTQLAKADESVSAADEVSFWIQLEMVSVEEQLEAARADLASCQSALLRDRAWNQHLLDVYFSMARCRAIWANGRPLGAWLASMQDHVNFLILSRNSGGVFEENMPVRLGSIRDINTIVATVAKSSKAVRFHLRLDRANDPNARPHKKSFGSFTMPRATEKDDKMDNKDDGLAQTQATRAGYQPVPPSGSILVEGLHLIGGHWHNNRIVSSGRDASGDEFDTEMPLVALRPTRGPPPRSPDWYCCPLVVACADACGEDLAAPGLAEVYVRTSMSPVLCALRGVRLVSYT